MAEHKIEKKNLDESKATMAELKLQGTIAERSQHEEKKNEKKSHNWTIYPQQIKKEKLGFLRIFTQNCNSRHQTDTVAGLCRDGAAFQQLIAAAIDATLNGASRAYGVVVEDCAPTLHHYSTLLTT